MNAKRRIIRTALLALIGLVVGCTIAWLQIQADRNQQTMPQAASNTLVSGIALDGSFDMTDHTGRAVTQADYDGRFKLIYFGFTYCPAICPTELQKIAQVMKALDSAQAEKIQPIFITVDPERDTVEVMRQYVEMFDPRLVGLRGTPEQTEKVKQGFKVFASKVDTEDGGDYTVDHSSFIYLMNPANQAVGIYRMQDDAAMITADIARILGDS